MQDDFEIDLDPTEDLQGDELDNDDGDNGDDEEGPLASIPDDEELSSSDDDLSHDECDESDVTASDDGQEDAEERNSHLADGDAYIDIKNQSGNINVAADSLDSFLKRSSIKRSSLPVP